MELSGKKGAVVCLGLAVGCLAVYGQVLGHGFVDYDDNLYVTATPEVRSGLSGSGVAWAFTTKAAGQFHPLTWLSHMLDCEVFGLRPWGHHLTSLLFHVASSLLFFVVMNRMTRRFWASALAAALFALHPLRVESVAWVSERKDVLSMFFWLLGMWAYASYAERRGLARYVLVVACFALGLMSKAMVVTFPCALLLLDYWPLGRFAGASGSRALLGRGAKLAIEKLPLFALTLAASLLTLVMQSRGGAIASAEAVSLAARVSNVPVAYAFYVWKALWPSGLAVAYPHPMAVRPWWQVCGSSALLLAVTGAVLWQARRRPYLPVGWFWFLGTLVPVIELVQAGAAPYADRYTYIPLMGLIIMVAWGVREVAARGRAPKTAVVAGAAGGLVALGIVAALQVGYWRDSKTLFARALDVTSGNSIAHYKMGLVLLDEGDVGGAQEHFKASVQAYEGFAPGYNGLGRALARQGKHAEALAMFRAAVSLDPGDAQALKGLANHLARMGRTDEAIAQYRDALWLGPDDPLAHTSLGFELAKQGRFDEAIGHYAKAVALDPTLARAHHYWGDALVKQGRLDEGIAHFRRVLEIDPADPEADYRWGHALLAQGRHQEAVAPFREAVRKDPGNAEYHYFLALELARTRQVVEAVAELEEAVRLNSQYAPAHNLLGALLTVLGRPDEAAAHCREALRIDPDLSTAHSNLGAALEKLDQRDEAVAHFRKALELDANDKAARAGLARLTQDDSAAPRAAPSGHARPRTGL